ncbi:MULTISPECIES: bifunctional DNA primase/polymerase [unclassified Nocardiopsis]|uniref:bifunctional DNA primase/polymerase n=1 Tax=unclassified Nocardiopsis TaxID=2649073 RepID=UPI00135A2D02|nr:MULTISPECIES: bifunctional DNA primase/polymerase [unclassified Nocardiopsis]
MATPQQRWALALVRAGFAVFACRPGRKEPATSRGVWDATTDEARVVEHWRVHPDHNIGVACGHNGLVVIDCDRPGPGWFWPADWAEIATQTWDGTDAYTYLMHDLAGVPPAVLLATMVVATASGGMHFYYQAPPGLAVRNSHGRLAPLVDVRARGGYVLGPGSVVNGRPYRPVTEHAPAPLPPTLVRALPALPTRQPSDPHPEPVVERLLHDMATAPQGQRHNTFVSRIMRLALDEAAGRVNLTGLEPRIRALGRLQGRTDAEITRALASARAKAARGRGKR